MKPYQERVVIEKRELDEKQPDNLKDGLLTFSVALDLLKKGLRVARKGWNGKGMWLVLIHPGNAMHTSPAGSYDMQPCIGMKTADHKMQPGWLASQADLLAEDWLIVATMDEVSDE